MIRYRKLGPRSFAYTPIVSDNALCGHNREAMPLRGMDAPFSSASRFRSLLELLNTTENFSVQTFRDPTVLRLDRQVWFRIFFKQMLERFHSKLKLRS